MPEKANLLPVRTPGAVNGFSSMARSGALRPDSFVRNVTNTAFNAVVHGNLADRAESFVVKSWHIECGAQLFIKLAKILQVRGQSRQLQAVVGEQKFLITGIPKARELSFDHDGRKYRELEFSIGALAEFRAAPIFFYAHDAARAAYCKTKSSHAFNGFWIKPLCNIPHGASRLKKARTSVKVAPSLPV